LEKSGIEEKDFPIIPLKSETELKEIIGFTKFKNTSILDSGGYFIPYPLQEGYFRLKLRYPIEGVKYLSPQGSPNYPYITKKVHEMAKEYNPDISIIFTEGEKKTAKAVKEGFMTIGLPGVWNFKSSDNDFLPQLENLNLKYRKCFIAFDSDIISKHSVRQAELRLAVNLINRGAIPLSIRFPAKKNGDKNGIDDFLVAYGKEEFQSLKDRSPSTFEQHLSEDTPTELILKEVGLISSKIEQEKILQKMAKHTKIPIQTLRNSINLKNEPEDNTEIHREEFTQEEKSQAEELLKSSDILSQMIKFTKDYGYVGEEINKKMLYFSFTSRLSDNSISCIVKGASASGKSTLVQSVLNLFPKEDILQFSFITAKALVHSKLDLSHKILFIQEGHGAEQADYSIRTVISEGEISIFLPIKNDSTNDFETTEKRIPAKGMVYVETTTQDQVHDENQTRVFDLYMDESEKQTELVLMAEAQMFDQQRSEKDSRIWRYIQNLLKPFEVDIPYARELVKIFPKKKIRVRRDFKRFLSLIKSHALLYQYQRERKDNKIIATIEDLKAILPLADKVLMQSFKEISPKQEKALEIIKEDFANDEFSLKQLYEKMGEDPCYKTVRNYLKRFESLGLVEWNGIKGAGSRYTFSSTLTLLPNSLFSWSNCLISLGLQLGKGNLPNDTPLPNYSEKSEKTDNELDNEVKSGKPNLPNPFSPDTNSYKELQNISGELGNEVNKVEEDQIESGTNLKLKPSISPGGDLIVPFNSDPEHQWWKGGNSIETTIRKIKNKKGD
jgi:hypothetical protein